MNDTITEQLSYSSEPQPSANDKNPSVNNCLSKDATASASRDIPLPTTRKTRTRNIVLPVRYRDQPRCADD